MNIAKDILPLTDFKRRSAEVLARLAETGGPTVLTVNGRPAVVMVDPEAWEALQDQLDYMELVAAVRQGLDEGRFRATG